MQQLFRPLTVVAACAMLALPRLATAQSAPAIPPGITTPDKVESRLGVLEFKDGMPSKETVAKVYDNLDFAHAFEVARYAGLTGAPRGGWPCRASIGRLISAGAVIRSTARASCASPRWTVWDSRRSSRHWGRSAV
jgi:hypothetical protein